MKALRSIFLAWLMVQLAFSAPGLCAAEEPPYLDVSISLFEHAGPGAGTEGETAETTGASEAPAIDPADPVRRAETRYMPMQLALHLVDSGHWGAVRVTPLPDATAELGITGEILNSGSGTLALHIRAVDSRGHVWLDQRFDASPTSSVSLYANPLLEDPYASLYTEVERSLALVLATLDTAQITDMKRLSLLRYGALLSPATFDPYFSRKDGLYVVDRLPAGDDPMLRRITAIRDREYLFIDVVDEQIRDFYVDIKPLYDLWRSSQAEAQLRTDDYTRTRLADDNDYRPGSYYSLREQYNRYRSTKVEEQYQRELMEGFANESAPTEMALDETLVSLQGTLEQQYTEWRKILRELFELETGAAE